MPRPPGKDQAAPMERLVRVIGVLNQHRRGAPLDLLLTVVAPATTSTDLADQHGEGDCAGQRHDGCDEHLGPASGSLTGWRRSTFSEDAPPFLRAAVG